MTHPKKSESTFLWNFWDTWYLLFLASVKNKMKGVLFIRLLNFKLPCLRLNMVGLYKQIHIFQYNAHLMCEFSALPCSYYPIWPKWNLLDNSFLPTRSFESDLRNIHTYIYVCVCVYTKFNSSLLPERAVFQTNEQNTYLTLCSQKYTFPKCLLL